MVFVLAFELSNTRVIFFVDDLFFENNNSNFDKFSCDNHANDESCSFCKELILMTVVWWLFGVSLKALRQQELCLEFTWLPSQPYTHHLVWWDSTMIWYLTYAATCEWFIEVIFASKLGFMPSTRLTFTAKTGKITQEDSVINFNHAVAAFTPAIIDNFVEKLQNKLY